MFQKLVFQGFREEDLQSEAWSRIRSVSKDIALVAPSDLNAALPAADGLLVKLGATVNSEIMDTAPNLKMIGMYGTGYGRIDVQHARNRKISVFNISDYATDAVAEFVFATLLSYIRELPRGASNVSSGNYSEDTFTGTELRGKSLGIIGLGAIGTRVAKIATGGFGMNVLYWSRQRKHDRENETLRYASLEAVLSDTDYISLHLALTPDTNDFLSSERLKAIRPGTVLVNTAPMELLNYATSLELLAAGKISLILDHSDEMRPDDVKAFGRYKSCVIYPPIAYVTREATIRKQEIFIKNIIAAGEDEPLPNRVA